MMKYYKDEDGTVYGYESDGSQDWSIKPGLISISEQEAMALASPPQPSTIPQSVTPAQGLMALYKNHDITEAEISAAIAGIEDAAMRYQATVAFTRATSWERQSEALAVVAGLMALTENDLDAAFTLAATYTNL
jgi:hypothetical protein